MKYSLLCFQVIVHSQNKVHYNVSTVNKVLRKLHAAKTLIKAASKLLGLSDLLALYYSHAHSALTYGITIWGHLNPTKGYLKPVLRTQKYIVHYMLTGSTYEPYSRRQTDSHMAELGILTVHALYALRVACTIHKYLQPNPTAHIPDNIHTYTLLHRSHSHRTRQAYPSSRTLYNSTRLGPLQSRYLDIWNNNEIIPPDIRKITDPKTFKKTLKRHLLKYQLEILSPQSTV